MNRDQKNNMEFRPEEHPHIVSRTEIRSRSPGRTAHNKGEKRAHSRTRQRISIRPAKRGSAADSPTQEKATGGQVQGYNVYRLPTGQKLICIVLSGLVFYSVGFLFYHHWIVASFVSLTGLLVPRYYSRFLLRRRRAALSMQFKQALYSLSSSLAAGKSVENGFREAVADMKLLSPDGDHDLIREFSMISAKMEYGQPVEEALQDFARRADMEDIINFSDVFATCKRTGGDLIEVVRRSSAVIGEKMDIQQEISVMIAQKRFEARVMFAAPFLFVLFMNISAADYMTPLYTGTGRMISTVCLLLLGCCLLWINKIMKINV
ncbi:type II secretion system F family protein [Paenibacillus sp. P96]|uniref:Type II secretion system F family protein n=1 Tax=Paenibacillus zeirhizosphaerae TaxID=2987519 RepID=A0ABT9FW36_9BACL|nr:type II secretion system F family protein [Paenibacillus sp. P96]MDP4098874.1 type II secretion system F family protein [Paenibacillus sp. P96]